MHIGNGNVAASRLVRGRVAFFLGSLPAFPAVAWLAARLQSGALCPSRNAVQVSRSTRIIYEKLNRRLWENRMSARYAP